MVIAFSLVVCGQPMAADIDIVFNEERFEAGERNPGGYFGSAPAFADVNGDGFSDLLVSEDGASNVHVVLGTAAGVDTETTRVLNVESSSYLTLFGYDTTAGDFDNDGYDDVAVGELVSSAVDGGAVWLFSGGPSGVDVLPNEKLLPVAPTGTRDDNFGHSVGAGDIDGDGYHDLVVGAHGAEVEGGSWVGAAYVYFGTSGGLDPFTEVVLLPERSSDHLRFGEELAGAGDIDGDGLDDLAVTCSGAAIDTGTGIDYYPCSAVYVYVGGSRDLTGVEPTVLHPSDTAWETYEGWNRYGESIAGAGDLDGDGYGDLAVGSRGTLYLYSGSAGGPTQDSEIRLSGPLGTDGLTNLYPNFGVRVAGAGDVDADGLDDLVVGTEGNFTEPHTDVAMLFFGAETGLSVDASITLAPDGAPTGDYYSWSMAGGGDVNGDGHADFIIGAYGDGHLEGAAYLYRPVCNWYADSDGDGYGDPTEHIASCDEPSGYADNAGDCDDSDPTVHGDTWYSDEDGDGYGTMAGAELACEQPAGTSESWLDCDDGDPARYPGAEDVIGDGIDQDCSGRDAVQEDTGDTGMEPVDTGQSAVGDDSGGRPGDTGNSADAGVQSGEPEGCGCATRARSSTWWLLLIAFARRSIRLDHLRT